MIADKSYSAKRLHSFLMEVDDQFSTPLSKTLKNGGGGERGTTLMQYAQKLADKATIAFQETDDGNIKGMVIGYIHDTENNSSYITQVVVKPAFRREGVFRTLFMEYEIYARKMGITSIWLTTRKDNISAKRAYESVGFVEEEDNGLMIKYRKNYKTEFKVQYGSND